VQLARRGPDADHHSEREADGARVDLGAVAGDHARLLQAAPPLRHGRRREADATAELGGRDPAGRAAVPALTDPLALLAGAGVGISSSVIPYISDQLAMRRLARATYALMVSLLPATATVIGVVVLAQVPSWNEGLGVALVIAGVAVHRERAAPDPALGCPAPCNSTESERLSPAGPPGSARRPRASLPRVERESPSPT
jgi:hypothetical protein